jgi:hypothetical protein
MSAARLLNSALAGFVLAMGFVGPRAQSFSFLLFAWMLMCFARAKSRGPKWLVFGALPLPLWANLHGGFLAGIGVAGVYGAIRVVEALRRRDHREVSAWVAVAALCGVAPFATPWGLDYPVFLLKSATMERPFVPEWRSAELSSTLGVLLALLAALAAISSFRRPRDWAALFALGVTILAALRHQRHGPFLAVAVLIFALPRLLEMTQPRTEAVAPSAWLSRALMATLGAGLLMLGALIGKDLARPPPAEPHFPANAIAELRARGLRGGLLVDFEWAQYVIFQALPDVRVAFDGRYEAVYPPEVTEKFMAWNYGGAGWEALANDERTTLALVAAGSEREKRLKTLPGWVALHRDEVATLFARAERVKKP